MARAAVAELPATKPASQESEAALAILPADTEVHLRLKQPVASNTHKRGQRFDLEVVEPVIVEGIELIPAGARAEGEVVHAAKSGFGGRAGELILASRYLHIGDKAIRLRSFSAGNGENRVNMALALSTIAIGLFVTGEEIVLPAGLDVYAKVAVDTEMASALETGPAGDAAALPIPEPTSTENDHDELSQQ